MPTGGERRSTNVKRSSSSAAKADRLSSPARACQVENPEVAEAVARHRESQRESLRSPKREAPPREVDRLERPAVDPCRLLEERAKITGQRNADLFRKALASSNSTSSPSSSTSTAA
jgi:hypothetical protein